MTKVTLKQRKALADMLHGMFCKYSHLDQCAYHYEDDWSKSEHTRWLELTTKALKATGFVCGDGNDGGDSK